MSGARIAQPMALMNVAVWIMLLGSNACSSEKSATTGNPPRGTQLASAFYIGPQPGPDHPLPRATNPYANDKTVLTDGRRLFNWYNCSGCHGDHGGGGMGPSLRDSLWYFGGDDAAIFASISQGRDKGMPAWGSKIPPDQIWRIVTYIRSMRTNDEPDSPR